MHTRKRGRSGSHRFRYTEKPTWVTASPAEIEDTIVQLRNSNLSSAVIGVRLRDQYGIPSTKAVLGKKLGDVLSEKELKSDIPEDLKSVIEKYKRVSKHLELNTADKKNFRSRSLLMAKTRRLIKYYKRKDMLPPGWNLEKVL